MINKVWFLHAGFAFYTDILLLLSNNNTVFLVSGHNNNFLPTCK